MKKKFEDDSPFPNKEPYSLLKLRQLISTLDKAEKNAFKRFIRNYSDDNHNASYIQLFDCVNECLVEIERTRKKLAEKPDPKASKEVFYKKFIKRFLHRAFAKAGDLGSMANYLYDKILETLRTQHLKTYARRELYAKMLDIQMLYLKGLFKECLLLIRSAKELAKQLEALTQSLELIQLERQILLSQRKKDLAEKLRTLYSEEQSLLSTLRATIELNDHRAEAYLAFRDKINLDQNEVLLGKMDNFIKYQTGQLKYDTFDLKFSYHSTLLFMISNDLNQPSTYFKNLGYEANADVLAHSKSIVDLFNSYPDRKKEEPARYRTNLINYASYVFLSKNPSEANLSQYDEEWNKIPVSDLEFLRSVVYLRLMAFIKSKDVLGGRNFLENNNVKGLLEELGKQIPVGRFQTICHLAGLIYFVRGDFSDAENYYALGLLAETQDSDAELMLTFKIYRLLARFEKDPQNVAILRNIFLKPISRQINAMAIAEPAYVYVLKVLVAVLKAGNQRDALKNVADAHLAKLKAFFPDATSDSKFLVFIGWVESKSTGRSLRIIMDIYL